MSTKQIQEILDRSRRIETALCRHISGKPDQRTHYTAAASLSPEGYEVEVNSMSISLQEIIGCVRKAGCAGKEFIIYDNGKPRLLVQEIRDMSQEL